MKTLKKVLFMVAFVILLTQTVRHAYYRWIEPKDSVLDKYGEPIEEKIKGAESLDELLSKYDDIQKKVKALEADSSITRMPRMDRAEIEPFLMRGFEKSEKEPYKSERKLRSAIQEWEMRTNEINKIRIYSVVGLLFVILGLFLYKRVNQWIGLAFLITGFAEKIYWTTPSFFGVTTLEYARLLSNKFFISLGAFIVLIIVGIMTNTISMKKE